MRIVILTVRNRLVGSEIESDHCHPTLESHVDSFSGVFVSYNKNLRFDFDGMFLEVIGTML